jgi:hypothetical protein
VKILDDLIDQNDTTIPFSGTFYFHRGSRRDCLKTANKFKSPVQLHKIIKNWGKINYLGIDGDIKVKRINTPDDNFTHLVLYCDVPAGWIGQ